MRTLRTVLAVVLAVGLGAGAAQAQCTLPYTLTNGQPPDATQVMANFSALISCFNVGGSTNSVQYNNGSGSLAGAGPLTNGQVLIGSTGNPPQPATITAGTGIAIDNAPGKVTVSAPSNAPAMYRQVMSPLPTAASTGLTNWLNQGTATFSETPVGISITSVPTNTIVGRFVGAPTAPYTLRALVAATWNTTSNVGIGFYDGTSKLQIISCPPGGATVVHWSSPTAFAGVDVGGVPGYLSQPIWLQLQDDGTNVSFAFSQDGANYLTVYSVAKSAGYLGSTGYKNLLFFVNPTNTGGSFNTTGTIMSWSIN
jgi:hypothetical protein